MRLCLLYHYSGRLDKVSAFSCDCVDLYSVVRYKLITLKPVHINKLLIEVNIFLRVKYRSGLSAGGIINIGETFDCQTLDKTSQKEHNYIAQQVVFF